MSREVQLAAFTVAGFAADGDGRQIPGLWRQLAARRADWPSGEQFGVGWPTTAGLRYLCGVRLPPGVAAADDFTRAEVPAGCYFRHSFSGDRARLGSAIGLAFTELVPAAGLRVASPLFFVAAYAGDAADVSQPQVSCEAFILLD
jgi:hypothetical protein